MLSARMQKVLDRGFEDGKAKLAIVRVLEEQLERFRPKGKGPAPKRYVELKCQIDRMTNEANRLILAAGILMAKSGQEEDKLKKKEKELCSKA